MQRSDGNEDVGQKCQRRSNCEVNERRSNESSCFYRKIIQMENLLIIVDNKVISVKQKIIIPKC